MRDSAATFCAMYLPHSISKITRSRSRIYTQITAMLQETCIGRSVIQWGRNTRGLLTCCGLAYNVRWTVGSETVFKGVKECW